MASAGKRLRNLLEGEGTLAIVGVPNALTARVVEAAGVKAVAVGGGVLSASLLGLVDAGFISLTEVAMMTRYTSAASTAPILVDADTGWGNAVSVLHTVRELERAGAGGLFIEDQVSPPRCGHISGKEVVPVDEMVGKIRAAVAARTDPDFVIAARTDARAVEGVEGAVERGNAYTEAGADMSFVDGVLSVEELRTFATEITAPFHLANMGGSGRRRTTPKVPLDELSEMGYDAALFGLQLTRATAMAVYDFAHSLAETGIQADVDLIERLKGTPFEDWYEYSGFNEVRELEERFLSAEAVAGKYEASAPDYPSYRAENGDGAKHGAGSSHRLGLMEGRFF